MNSPENFVPLKLTMLKNSNLQVYVKMASNIIPLHEMNQDKKFLEEFLFRNKDNDNFFFVRKKDLADFIKNASSRIKECKSLNDCVVALSIVGELMFENMKASELSESSINDGFDLIKYTVNSENQRPLLNDIIKNLSVNPNIGVQSLSRSIVCFLIAQALGWQREKNYQHLIISSILADIGNVLSPDEPHPKNSLKHLGPYISNPDIHAIVSHHHENFDGSGPLNMSRNHIHPLAKLLRVADEISLNSSKSLHNGILSAMNEQRNLFEKEPIFKLLEYMKLKKLIKS